MEPLENITIMPGVLFREIHKNGCLKRYSSERRTGFPRKTDRVWVVFCVHDDTEAFLEFYPDHKIALTHKPEGFVSLHNVLHVSPSICGQADEFEFAVTLPSQVIRLAAASWDSMMEWVESIRNKLRELRVLAPKENVYSKMPEPRHALLPTRDPTSPLPLPPIGALGLVPGVETPVRITPAPPLSPPVSETTVSSTIATPEEHNIFRTEILSPNSEPSPGPSGLNLRVGSNSSTKPQMDIISASSGNVEQNELSGNAEQQIRKKEPALPSVSGSSIFLLNNETTNPLSRPSIPPPLELNVQDLPSNGNVTVIEVPPPPSPHYEHLFIPDEQLHLPPETRAKLERLNSSGLIPRVPSRVPKDESRSTNHESGRNRDRPPMRSPEASVSSPASVSSDSSQSKSAILKIKPSTSKESTKQLSVVHVGGVSVVSVDSPLSNKVVAETANTAAPTNDSRHQIPEPVPPLSAALQPTPTGFDVKDIPLIGGHQRRRRRSSSSDAGPPPRGIAGADLIRVMPNDTIETQDSSSDSPRLTLRETQVCQLKREMEHPGGVRLPLRRKDCFGAIALVDISNAVWVAGWKQREHPLLYNALHIGDQVISIGEFPVRSSTEAQKLLKGPSGPTLELVVRRLPLGKVLTLHRPRGAGSVGLQVDPTSPGEVTVTPGGVAARAGLPALTPTMDGLGLTTWTLTEINGRPLNLMCKPTDITTRLNSVGKEISILVQPSDFIKQLRKQLKNVRGYKDYLLQ